ncbi:MAG: biotin transporter BioY [Selenomonadaceae bacterium]|nr:biotin transporter BioY [Selenomonadaceae bacterium]
MPLVENKKISTAELTKMSMCVALCCAAAYISFPLPFTPAPVTASTLVLSLTAFILTPRQTFTVILIYILLGIAGLPVFAGGTSGLGKIFGPTGGFILAWLISYPILSEVKGSTPKFSRYVIADLLTATPITYIGGLISMYLVMEISISQAFTMAVLPFIPGGVIKTLAAAFLGVRLNRMQKNF